jgi:sortase A
MRAAANAGAGVQSPALATHPGSRPEVSNRRRWLKRVGVLLVGTGLLLVAVPGSLLAYGTWQERQLTQQWKEIVSEVPAPVSTAPPAAEDAGTLPAAAPVPAARPVPITTKSSSVPIAFAIRVPKIGYYSAVVEGVGLSQLATGPGHYTNTPYPGHPGVVGVAAHNTYWIQFGGLKPGDEIVLETRYGTYTYRITGTRIVAPDDRSVFAQKAGYRLTLTTCWPLWAGALADHRLAIFAEEEGGVA